MRVRPAPLRLAAAVAAATVAIPVHAGATSNFSELPGGLFLDIGQGPFDVFGPFDFDFGGGQVVTATMNPTGMSCPDNVGNFWEPVTHTADPAVDPGDHIGRALINTELECPDQTLTLDFSEPVRAIGASFKHYSCGFLQQSGRTIVAYTGPGGTGAVVGSATTAGYAIPCFAIWIDFVGVISDQDDIRSMRILSDADYTLITGLALSAGSGPVCPADVSGDGTVDVTDLLDVLAAWGAAGGPADVTNDGIVDVADLLDVLAAWGGC